MKVEVGQKENNTVKINIEVEADVVSQEYGKACKRVSNHVNIPGFRKGKAPKNMVEKYVGKPRIQQEAIDRILPNIIADTISENMFDLATEPVIENYKFELGQPLTLEVKLELKPEVNLKEYKGLTVEVEANKLEEDSIEKELESIASRMAEMTPVTDRATGDKDVAVIDFEGFMDGEAFKGGSGKNYSLDLGNSTFIPGFAEQLVRKKIGEEVTVNVTFPEEYHEESLKGKPAEFKVTINEIKEKKTPAIDDELAKKASPFQTLEELKADIKKFQEEKINKENEDKAEKALLDKIISDTEIDIPDTMINKEAKLLMQELEQRLTQQGMNWNEFLENEGQEKIWNNLREDAEKRVKNSLVLGAIAKEEKIMIDDKDFQEHIKELAQAYKTEEKEIYKQISQAPEFAQMFSQQILGQKIVKFVKENNEVKFV